MSLDYALAGSGLAVATLAVGGRQNWCCPEPATTSVAVVADGRPVELTARDTTTTVAEQGVVEDVTRCFSVDHPGLEIEWRVRRYSDLAILESWVWVRNASAAAVSVDRLDSIVLELDSAGCELRSFTSGWGAEFDGAAEPLEGAHRLESLAGRSSQGCHPCFTLARPDGSILTGHVAWSGNWVVRFEPRSGGGHTVSAGLHDEGFAAVLRPGEEIEAPRVIVAVGDADSAPVHIGQAARRYWAPRNALADRLPVEWNHWWTYEDRDIDEAVFRANAEVAATIGVEVCTLDAGWFGPAEPNTQWTDYRGDWDSVNTRRFPSGLRALADHVHSLGMSFGLWCEIEALGPKSALAARRPDFSATRGNTPLGYVCFGNPEATNWALATLDRLVREHGADWIKLDFNLDPGLGCDRTDHGHGPGDGLFAHYRGYYDVLERMRGAHPEVVLENCSSGGLRIDLGLLRQTHLTFLSDPDWPEHGLQLLWGATTVLPPNQLLHWGWSQWRGEHPEQTFDPADPDLRPHQIDYYRRIAMLGATGMSYGLPGLPDRVRTRLATNIQQYKELVRPFVRAGDLHRLTGQPRRYGKGERWAGFQYSLPGGTEHLVLVFRLSGGKSGRSIPLCALAEPRRYEVRCVDSGLSEIRTGADLMAAGLRLPLPEEGSEIVVVRGM